MHPPIPPEQQIPGYDYPSGGNPVVPPGTQITVDCVTDFFTGQPLDRSKPIIAPPYCGGAPSGPPKSGGTQPFDISALKWLGALILLWIILTAMSEYSPNTKMLGQAFAGLILLGALFYLGPAAISNVKNIWTQTGSSPVQGPNPVPGG